jgi:hypothetical protein
MSVLVSSVGIGAAVVVDTVDHTAVEDHVDDTAVDAASHAALRTQAGHTEPAVALAAGMMAVMESGVRVGAMT